MALNQSQVSRNLNAQIVFAGIEFEDLLVLLILAVVGMLIGQFCFPNRYVLFLPMNWAMMLGVAVAGVPGLMLLKYGKPRGYISDLGDSIFKPKAYSCLERSATPKPPYIKTETEPEGRDAED